MLLKIANAILAVIGGVGGVVLAFYLMNALVERLPRRVGDRLLPYVFVGPAILAVTIFLVYPAVRTIVLSFFDRRSERFVGADNYVSLLGSDDIRTTILNNVLWLIVVPVASVAAGLAVAALADRLKPRAERLVKSVVFLPMAISFVGASTIWRFVYTFAPEGRPQIGLLNGLVTAVGLDPQPWLNLRGGNFNDFLLMVIMVWAQAGFAMVLLSAAIKGVPDDTIEAARVDGARESQIFWRVVVPQIRPTIAVVLTTILILVLKIFDIVFVMTGGNFDTDVIANRFITELFTARDFGRAAAVMTVLLLTVVPVMIVNIRRFRAEEAAR